MIAQAAPTVGVAPTTGPGILRKKVASRERIDAEVEAACGRRPGDALTITITLFSPVAEEAVVAIGVRGTGGALGANGAESNGDGQHCDQNRKCQWTVRRHLFTDQSPGLDGSTGY